MKIYVTNQSRKTATVILRILGVLLIAYGLVYPHLYRISPMIYSYLGISGTLAMGVGVFFLVVSFIGKKNTGKKAPVASYGSQSAQRSQSTQSFYNAHTSAQASVMGNSGLTRAQAYEVLCKVLKSDGTLAMLKVRHGLPGLTTLAQNRQNAELLFLANPTREVLEFIFQHNPDAAYEISEKTIDAIRSKGTATGSQPSGSSGNNQNSFNK